MDKISIIDLCRVGIPEITLSILIGLVICEGNVFKKLKDIWGKLILQIIISNIIILSVIWVVRQVFSNMLFISLINLVIYIIIFAVVFSFNWRKAVFSGIISYLLIMIADIVSTPIMNFMFFKILRNNNFFNDRFKFSIIPRIIQLLVLFIILYFDFNYKDNNLLDEPFKKLTRSSKVTLVAVVVLLLSSVILNTNYSELYVQLSTLNVDLFAVGVNSYLYLVQSIIFLIMSLLVLDRTIGYEKYKIILSKTSEEFIEKIINSSSYHQINTYADIIMEALNITSIERVDKYLKELMQGKKETRYKIDDSLSCVSYDFTDLLMVLSFLLNRFVHKHKYSQCNIHLYKKQKNIYGKIIIKTNEFDANKYLKQILKSPYYKHLEQDFTIYKQGNIDINIKSLESVNIIIYAPLVMGGEKYE